MRNYPLPRKFSRTSGRKPGAEEDTMEQLCKRICMPGEAARRLLDMDKMLPDPACRQLLRQESCWEEGLKTLRQELGDDPDGWKELCCMLRCAVEAKADFDRLGLSEDIYVDTMGCFSRFVREHMESYGRYGFDRGFWTVRQVSCRLLRIGQLEYELVVRSGAPMISLHIPTDVLLQRELLDESLREAWKVIGACFPDYQNVSAYCHSWLLSPALQALLPENSRILQFQKRFSVTALDQPCDDVIQWVFKNPTLAPEQYPENTSLQRKLKAFLLGGGFFADARGILIREDA